MLVFLDFVGGYGINRSQKPVLVMLHGGGWCLGGLDNEALLCQKWSEDFGGLAFNVDYRLAPEHVFPVAVHDAYDSVSWVS
jgi:acetyl esterase/lipase